VKAVFVKIRYNKEKTENGESLKKELIMFIKVRGTKAGVNGEGVFIVNIESIKDIEILLGDNIIMYLFDDPKGIMVKEEDFNRLYPLLEVKDCTFSE